MIEQVNEGEFIQRFAIMDRKENFSYEGRKALFKYFEELEGEQDKQIEFDCIAICCEYSEYKNLAELNREYAKEYKSIDEVEEDTQVIRIDDNSFIIQVF